jgi:putative PEP-CTERM system histidine kinase
MFIFVISAITVIALVLVAFAVHFRPYNRISHIAFSLSTLSTAVMLIGDTLCILRPEMLQVWKKIVFIDESVMVTCWLLFSICFARADYWGVVNKLSKLLLFVSPVFIYFLTAIPIEEYFYSPEFDIEKILFLGNMGYVFNILLLIYSIVTILNLEATLRSSSGINKWQIKYTLMGAGSIVAMNIFYYSYALLYRSLNMNLLPVRSGVILVSAILIGFSSLKHMTMNVEIVISRRALYKSLGVFVIGFYLLGLGIIGEGMRYLGPQVGKNITTFIGFVGAMFVLAILLSEQLRRKAIVIISKNFFSSKYDYREQWLRFTQRISLKHTLEELLDSIAEGFKETIGSRGVSVWLKEKDNGEYLCVRVVSSDMVHIKPNKKLIEFLQNKNWIVNANDKHCEEVVADSKEFMDKSQAALIVPLNHIGKLIGFIILRAGLADNKYNYEDYDLLKTLAKQATLAIMNAQLSVELTEAKEMEAMGRLSSFIVHDLKNAASMLSLVAQNAEEHMDNPDFQRDAVRTIYNSAEKIKKIIGTLKNLPSKPRLELEYFDLGACVKSAVEQLNLNGNSKVSLHEVKSVYTQIDKDEIVKVIINIIMNALDATKMQGEIKLSVGIEDDMAFIKISDNGCGMSADFIEKRLFKPFQTTKDKGLGIGLYQCKAIVDAHFGKIMVESREGRGTDFIVYFPLVNP